MKRIAHRVMVVGQEVEVFTMMFVCAMLRTSRVISASPIKRHNAQLLRYVLQRFAAAHHDRAS